MVAFQGTSEVESRHIQKAMRRSSNLLRNLQRADGWCESVKKPGERVFECVCEGCRADDVFQR